MEDWTPFVLILGFLAAGGILVLGFVWPRRPDARRRRMWEAVTTRLGGKLFLKEGDYRVRFRWHGLDAVLSEGDLAALEIAGDRWGSFEIELVPRVLKHDVRLASAEFDETTLDGFALASPDLAGAREFLTAPVRQILADLRLVGEEGLGSAPRVRIGKGFHVQAKVWRSAESLGRFALLCLQLAQHALVFSRRAGGIDFLEGAGQAGECQVCGAALEGTLVSCSRCATPHHRDCWDYVGRCSTYGCGGTRGAGA
jgi:hypothetical protein